MKKYASFLIISLFFFMAPAFGQVVKTAAVTYTKGASPYTPNIASSSEIRVDTATSGVYWWDRGSLTWRRFYPGVDVITGSIPPAYTPTDNQSLFAVNDDDELYYYNGAAWVQIGGSGGGGIYGGSGTVPDATVATLADDFEFSGPDISSFTVTTGTTTGGQYFSNFSGATVSHRDSSGQSALQFTGTGANFNFTDGSTDRLTITGRDARYAADYSGTFSARSLVDKGYVDGAVVADHGALTGLSDDDHTQYALLAGRATGQTLTGGTASGDDLTLRSTTDATKGDIIIADQGGNVTVGGGATASELRILEPSGSGSNYVSLKTDASAANASLSLAYATSTANTASLTVGSGDTNAGVALVPKGTGALTAAVPDGASTGGNARGTNAIDLQTSRDGAAQVASGSLSGIFAGRRNTASATAAICIGGADNTASGNGAVVIGGYSAFSSGGDNIASGVNSIILGGTGNRAQGTSTTTIGSECTTGSSATYSIATGTKSSTSMQGEVAHANGSFSTAGDAQVSYLNIYETITGTAQTEMLNDASFRLILPATNTLWNFRIDLVGVCSDIGNGSGITAGDMWSSWHCGAIKRLNTTTSLVGTVQTPATAQSDAGMSTTVVTVDADDTNESLRIRITPPTTAGSTTVTRWVAYVHLTAVAY